MRRHSLTIEQIYNAYNGDKEGWSKAWLSGFTDWWPDCIPLEGTKQQPLVAGSPSSPMPDKAQRRIDRLRKEGLPYVWHVSIGTHAYCIGYVDEYTLADTRGGVR